MAACEVSCEIKKPKVGGKCLLNWERFSEAKEVHRGAKFKEIIHCDGKRGGVLVFVSLESHSDPPPNFLLLIV